MSKNTASNAFRKIDVDQFNEDNFTDEEKRKYHERMSSRNKKSDLEQRNFHRRMSYRFKANTNLPTYPTPEAEKEAEQ